MRLAKERLILVLIKLHEQVSGTKRDWLGMRGDDGDDDMLLGFEIIRRLTEKRSPMEARSRRFGAVAR